MKKWDLPKGWEWNKLGSVCEKAEYGYTTSASKKGVGPKLLRTTDISSGRINWDSVPYCSFHPNEEERYSIKNGDILISRAGSVGASIVIANPPRSVFASYLIRFRPKKGINPYYLGYFLKSNYFFNQLVSESTGTTLKGVNATNLSRIELPIPPLETQQKIVAILDKAEEIKRLRAEANTQTQKLIQSVFLDMFGDPVKNPKGWKKERLGNFVRTLSGGTPLADTRSYYNGPIPFIKSGDLRDDIIAVCESSITQEGLDNSSAKIVEKGTLLMAMYGATAGKLGFLNFDAAINQAVCALFPNKNLNKIYLYQYLLMARNLVLSQRVGGAQPNISQEIIKNYKIALPPLKIQYEFQLAFEAIQQRRVFQQYSQSIIDQLLKSIASNIYNGELVA